MGMTQERFEALVQRLERYAHKHPQSYKLRVGLLAGLGYGYILLAFVILVAIASVTVSILVAIAYGIVQGGFWLQALRFLGALGRGSIVLLVVMVLPVVMVVDLVRSLWVRIPKPTGIPLRRSDAPHLFALIDDLTRALQAPPPNRVLLTPEFNAAVLQRPRLGLFGWDESYLLLGLPLMQALSPDQFRAVLAHEFGHLSGNHSRFGGWIYRQRLRWAQLLDRFQANGGASLFNRFILWYAPFFQAYSFVLARMDEYEADRCAARFAGADSTAAALVNLEVKGRYLQQSFWSEVFEQVEYAPDPPAQTYSRLATALKQPAAIAARDQWLQEALAQTTDHADTHPCLRDRLQGLGIVMDAADQLLIDHLPETAADQFLGDGLPALLAEFDQSWQTEMSTTWRQRFAHLQTLKQDLKALEEKSAIAPLSVEDQWRRVSIILELRGEEESIPVLQAFLRQVPDHATAHYLLGVLWLNRGDRAGVAHLEQAMDLDLKLVLPVCQHLCDYFAAQQEPDAVEKYRQRAIAHQAVLAKAEAERSTVQIRDQFRPHTLTESELTALRRQLSAHPEVKAVYLVEKVVQYLPEWRFFVLGIVRKEQWFEDANDATQALINRVVENLEFPYDYYVLILNHGTIKKLNQKILTTADAQIFPA